MCSSGGKEPVQYDRLLDKKARAARSPRRKAVGRAAICKPAREAVGETDPPDQGHEDVFLLFKPPSQWDFRRSPGSLRQSVC